MIGKLQIDDDGGPLLIDDDVKLSYYRLTKTHEGSASLQPDEPGVVPGPTTVGTGRPRQEDVVALSQLVDVLNEKFGTDFTEEDQLFSSRWLSRAGMLPATKNQYPCRR